LEARITSGLRSVRVAHVGGPYRPVRSGQATIDEIRDAAGTQFDPKVVEALVRSVTERSWRAGHLELLTA
jgi:response regulator RpfG family c-di-GMP phosphodiesterase